MTFLAFISDVNTNADCERGAEFLREHKDEYPELRDAFVNNLHATPDSIIDLIALQYPLAKYWKFSGLAKAYIANLQQYFLTKGTS